MRILRRTRLRWATTAPASRIPSSHHPRKQYSTHHDLSTFLSHSRHTAADTSSPTYIGTHYEYTVQQSLAAHGLALTRTGGRLDRGIDLLGSWSLPTLPKTNPLHVLVQCKSLAKKLSPAQVRELEGTFPAAPKGWRVDGDGESPSNVVALLASPLAATKGVVDAMAASKRALAFVCVTREGMLQQVRWNHCAADMGLAGMGVSVRHSLDGSREVVLVFEGKVSEFG